MPIHSPILIDDVYIHDVLTTALIENLNQSKLIISVECCSIHAMLPHHYVYMSQDVRVQVCTELCVCISSNTKQITTCGIATLHACMYPLLRNCKQVHVHIHYIPVTFMYIVYTCLCTGIHVHVHCNTLITYVHVQVYMLCT